MIFNSMLFLWVFLPIAFILDRICRKSITLRNVMLVLLGLIFYAWGSPSCLVLLVISILVNYGMGILMERLQDRPRLIALIAGILFNMGILGYYKYFNFFGNTANKVFGRELIPHLNLVLPLGISFFTFQALTYLIDLYKGKTPAQKNLLHIALYFAFFPKLTQGPIEKYTDFEPQIISRTETAQKTAAGLRRFIYGLAKKLLIADILGQVVAAIYSTEIAGVSSAMAWVASAFYMLQIYYDFSGYSDMAVGLGLLFGFDLKENFRYPYIADSVTDFWRRWHISLTDWFREYLYFPLGGSRKGAFRTYLNIMIIYMATGLWHGASWDFIFWGLYHGFFQIIERAFLGKIMKKTKVLKYIYTTLEVLIGWVFFSIGDLAVSFKYLKRMFLPWMYKVGRYSLPELVNHRAWLMFAIGVLGCGLLQTAGEKLAGRYPVIGKWKHSSLEMVWCMALLVISVIAMVSSTYSAFIYMNF